MSRPAPHSSHALFRELRKGEKRRFDRSRFGSLLRIILHVGSAFINGSLPLHFSSARSKLSDLQTLIRPHCIDGALSMSPLVSLLARVDPRITLPPLLRGRGVGSSNGEETGGVAMVGEMV